MNYLEKIQQERLRQIDLPGSEYDLNHSPNDWSAIVCYYASEAISRRGKVISKEEFEDSMIKAAATALAALEHVDHMVKNHMIVKQQDGHDQ
jgi:hypothetical protein